MHREILWRVKKSNKKCNCEGVEQLPKNKLYFIGVD